MELNALLPTLLGTLIGGVISYAINRQQHRNHLQLLMQQHKTEYMAEETVRHFLRHERWIDRSFEVVKKHVGGFEDDELRKILVRAGAIRVYRDDGSEWWTLLERQQEKRQKRGKAVH